MLKIIHRVNKTEDLKTIPKEYGVEVDVRRYDGKLILNHDYGDGDLLEDYLKEFKHKFIIFNLKETGIEEEIIKLAKRHRINDYFLLNVEPSYTYEATRKNSFRNIAVRLSEIEPIENVLAQKGFVDWAFIDSFSKLPVNKETYKKLNGFKLCLVCPGVLNRPEDISRYKDYVKKNNIKLDAVMTRLELAAEWD